MEINRKGKEMSIVGFNSSKDYLYAVMTTATKTGFAVIDNHRLPIDSHDLASLFSGIETILRDYNARDPITKVSVLKCSTGKYTASPEAFKAEGLAELKCQQLGFSVAYATRQSLKKTLNCEIKQKWQDVAKVKFNGDGAIKYFSLGFDGATSVAFGYAG